MDRVSRLSLLVLLGACHVILPLGPAPSDTPPRDGSYPDAADTATPEMPVADMADAAADMAVADMADAAADTATSDTATSDSAPPDTATSDTAPPDTAAPDLLVPDLALPDAKQPPQLMVMVSNGSQRYSISGQPLGSTMQVPYPGTKPSDAVVRDLVSFGGGKLAFYNGTFTPYLTIYDPKAGFSHETTGMSTVNAQYGGGVAAWKNLVFATSMQTAYNPFPKVAMFDTATKLAASFTPPDQSCDITVGLDGKLYVLDTINQVFVYQLQSPPSAPKHIDTIKPSLTQVRAIAVNAQSEIFATLWSGAIQRLSSTGAPLTSLNPKIGNLIDIDLGLGVVVASSSTGKLVVTDESFSNPMTFSVGSSPAYVAIVP